MSAHWTEARIEQVRTMWADGFSASQIARALGDGISRNAVIGIIHRRHFQNGKPPRSTYNKKMFVPGKRFASGTVRRGSPVIGDLACGDLPPEPVVALDPIPDITIANVTDKQCRWPYGDPALPDFHLCGHPTITLSPYCAIHARKAFAPGYVRPRKDEAGEELSEIYRRERVFA